MRTTIAEVIQARSLAEDLGHAYFTVEHILTASLTSNQQAKEDLLGFIKLNIPMAEPCDIAMPTMGVQLVAKRLAQGSTLYDAVMAEGEEAHGPHFIKKHNLTQQDFNMLGTGEKID